jgi:cytochrome c biogenesis protein CcdA
VLGAGVHFIVDYVDFVIFVVGIIMCILGGWMIIRGQLYFLSVQRGSNYITSFNVSGNLNYFFWGIGYGLVSLGCTLPVFLAVSGISLISSSITSVILQFLLYGFGMSLVLTIMMVLISITSEGVSRIRILVPYMTYVGPILMVLTGGYLIYYWIKVSELAM